MDGCIDAKAGRHQPDKCQGGRAAKPQGVSVVCNEFAFCAQRAVSDLLDVDRAIGIRHLIHTPSMYKNKWPWGVLFYARDLLDLEKSAF